MVRVKDVEGLQVQLVSPGDQSAHEVCLLGWLLRFLVHACHQVLRQRHRLLIRRKSVGAHGSCLAASVAGASQGHIARVVLATSDGFKLLIKHVLHPRFVFGRLVNQCCLQGPNPNFNR